MLSTRSHGLLAQGISPKRDAQVKERYNKASFDNQGEKEGFNLMQDHLVRFRGMKPPAPPVFERLRKQTQGKLIEITEFEDTKKKEDKPSKATAKVKEAEEKDDEERSPLRLK